MGPGAGTASLVAGVLVVLWTIASRAGVAGDLTLVAGAGLLVCAGAASVAFASRGPVRMQALGGAALSLVPSLVLAGYLAAG